MSAPAVPTSYAHYGKQCVPGALLAAGGARFKWYDIFADPIDAALVLDARAFVTSETLAGRCAAAGDIGFVILHRCGADFYFLLVQVWRGANECWETVYYRDGSTDGFSVFPAAYPAAGQPSRPTFCVWELGAVAHEARTWSDYLRTERGDSDTGAYLASSLIATV